MGGQVLQMAPPVYNISPEQFATLSQGGTLSQEQINSMMGVAPGVPQQPGGAVSTQSGSPAVAGPGAASAAPNSGSASGTASGTPPAPASADQAASKKKKSEKASKKKLDAKKKKSKGCC